MGNTISTSGHQKGLEGQELEMGLEPPGLTEGLRSGWGGGVPAILLEMGA